MMPRPIQHLILADYVEEVAYRLLGLDGAVRFLSALSTPSITIYGHITLNSTPFNRFMSAEGCMDVEERPERPCCDPTSPAEMKNCDLCEAFGV